MWLTDGWSETFELFAHDFPSSNLGFVDSTAREVEVSVGSRLFTLRQSPGLLSSNRKEGTTGAGKVQTRGKSLSPTQEEANAYLLGSRLESHASLCGMDLVSTQHLFTFRYLE